MKIAQNVAELERGGDLGEEISYSIEFSDKMARILSKGIYKNVIRAPIRELICNAWDSHRAAGKLHVPVQVHLPSMLEPWFEVRDQGVGLSHEKVLRLFTRYGASDKSHANDDIGGFGLGSKAPFAYTNTFTVSAVWQGVRREYVMFQNAVGKPSVNQMGESPTDACNGVTVRMPVKPDDVNAFRVNAQEVIKWFSDPVDVSGNSKFKLPEIQYREDMTYPTWAMLDDDHAYHYGRGGAQAIMSHVAYPISEDNLDKKFHNLLRFPLVIRFQNGELEPAVSREELNYDPQTVQVLETRLNQILNQLRDQVNSQIDQAATLWQARVELVTMLKNPLLNAIMDSMIHAGKLPTYKDQVLCNSRHNAEYVYWDTVFGKDDLAPEVMDMLRFVKTNPRVSFVMARKNTLIVLQDCSDASARCKAAYRNKHKGEVYLVRGVSKDAEDKVVTNATQCAQVARWLAHVGAPEVILASSLAKPNKVSMKFKGVKWTGGQSRYYKTRKMDNWTSELMINTDQGGFYVTMDGFTPWHDELGTLNLDGIKAYAEHLGIVPKGTTIWGLNKTNTKLVVKNTKWTEYSHFVKTQLQAMIVKHDVPELIRRKQQAQTAIHLMYDGASEWMTQVGHMQNALGAYVRAWHQMCVATHAQVDVDVMRKLAQELKVPVDVTDTHKSQILELNWDQVVATYPLLKHAVRMRVQEPAFQEFVDYVKLIDATRK